MWHPLCQSFLFESLNEMSADDELHSFLQPHNQILLLLLLIGRTQRGRKWKMVPVESARQQTHWVFALLLP
jgi:hypothetical protein